MRCSRPILRVSIGLLALWQPDSKQKTSTGPLRHCQPQTHPPQNSFLWPWPEIQAQKQVEYFILYGIVLLTRSVGISRNESSLECPETVLQSSTYLTANENVLRHEILPTNEPSTILSNETSNLEGSSEEESFQTGDEEESPSSKRIPSFDSIVTWPERRYWETENKGRKTFRRKRKVTLYPSSLRQVFNVSDHEVEKPPAQQSGPLPCPQNAANPVKKPLSWADSLPSLDEYLGHCDRWSDEVGEEGDGEKYISECSALDFEGEMVLKHARVKQLRDLISRQQEIGQHLSDLQQNTETYSSTISNTEADNIYIAEPFAETSLERENLPQPNNNQETGGDKRSHR